MSLQATQTSTLAAASHSEKRLKIHPRTTAPARMAEVIGRRALGHTKQQIAKDLGMSRNTVDSILAESKIDHDWSKREQELIPKAFNTLEKAIDRGDQNIAIRFIENVVWTRDKSPIINDMRVQTAISTLITTGQPSTDRTEAAAKAPPVSKSDQVQTQFLPISASNSLQTHDLAASNAQLSFSFMEDP